MKDKKEENPLERLIKLTKVMKDENIKVAPKGPPKAANKWRGSNPKFAPKAEPAADRVAGGGMQVDPARKDEYDNWRKDKIEEQKHQREAAARKAKAAEAASLEAKKSAPSDPA